MGPRESTIFHEPSGIVNLAKEARPSSWEQCRLGLNLLRRGLQAALSGSRDSRHAAWCDSQLVVGSPWSFDVMPAELPHGCPFCSVHV